MVATTMRGVVTLATLCLALLIVAVNAQALTTVGGSAVPNTGPGAEAEAGFGHVAGAPNVLSNELLDSPFDLSDAGDAAAAAALWSPGTPENDLAAALDTLAGAASASEAEDARRRAVDILEGNPINKKAYSGIPLLNWNPPSKVKTVPAGGTVEIKQVRWGEHMVSDTWLLDFADPDQPFKIRYRVAELGSAFGGELNPTPLLSENGTPIGGQHSAIQPLGIDTNIALGTHQGSRFTNGRGLGDVAESTRSAMQEVTVDMPPPRLTTAILDPSLRAGHESATTLLPATAARRAAIASDKRAAIARLADAAPEKQIWSALDALPAQGDPGFLAAAHDAGAQLRDLVGSMRSRTELPAGVVADPGADATVVLQNNEAYLTRHDMRLDPGGSLRVQVVNRDGFAHTLTGFDLHKRNRIFGAWDWGEFDWNEAALQGGSPTLDPNSARTFTVTPASDTFALWLGDLESGDQADAVISLDRGIKQQALGFGTTTTPVHPAPDRDGNVWVTLAGTDTIARIHPAGNLADSQVDRFPLPNGRHVVDSPTPPLGPADVTVDGRGIVWSTLASGNAIARIDPSQVNNGTADGIKILPLEPCRPAICRPTIPPVPNELPTRSPSRLKTFIDGEGNTVLWFTEANTSLIGAMRITEDGRKLDEAHFSCGCFAPESLDLAADGSVWFVQITENQLGRIRPDVTRPFAPSAARIEHYDIPRKTLVPSPPLFPNLMTSLPLSVAVDGRGRVWFSESALSSIAFLDPEQAQPNTSQGFTEVELPHSAFRSAAAPADIAVDRANNLWWAGEYGDQIEQITPDGQIGMRFRSSVRRGITESPISDTEGNLWIVETGGNLVTRISGIAGGPLVPFGLPAALEADTTRNTVSGERLRDTTSVTVRIVRGGNVAAHADAPVRDGAFSISAHDWRGAADGVRAEDVVRIQPHGPYARAELSYRVANLTAAVGADGGLSGRATADGQPLGERVHVAYEGGASSAGIDGGDGRWNIRPARHLGTDARGSVAWSAGTVAASFRTITRFGEPDASQAGRAPVDPKLAAALRQCALHHWLAGTAKRPSLPLLGLTRTQLRKCMGKPTVRAAASRKHKRPERWRYGKGTRFTFRSNRVAELALTDKRLRSAQRRVGVGSTVAALRKVLPVKLDRRTHRYRAVVKLAGGSYADVRVRNAGGPKHIDSISIRTLKRAQLDKFARGLLRRHR